MHHPDISHPHIAGFLTAIRPWQQAYGHSTLSFVAVQHRNQLTIVRARITLSAQPQTSARPPFSTPKLRAAEMPIDGTGQTITELINAALAGDEFSIGSDALSFLKEQDGGFTASHEHATTTVGMRDRGYVDRLSIWGASRWNFLSGRDVELEKELHPHGFQSLSDLMREYGFTLSATDSLTIEVVAEPVAHIEATSQLRLRTANLSVRLAAELSPEALSLVIVDAESHGANLRRPVPGRDIAWEQSELGWSGTCTLEIPQSTVLTCRAIYEGALHDEVQIADPAALPNLRRMLVELADPNLLRIRGPLTQPKNDQERNEFEAGIATLFFMLGFEVVRVGGMKKLSDAADIFATTPAGEILIVECATEVLDPRGKINKLIDRVEAARAKLCAAWPGLLVDRVTGVLVIPRMRQDLGPEWKIAEQRGVLVLSRSEIEAALASTQFTPDADKALAQWRQRPLIELMTRGLDAG